jgi:hypothetical protein
MLFDYRRKQYLSIINYLTYLLNYTICKSMGFKKKIKQIAFCKRLLWQLDLMLAVDGLDFLALRWNDGL